MHKALDEGLLASFKAVQQHPGKDDTLTHDRQCRSYKMQRDWPPVVSLAERKYRTLPIGLLTQFFAPFSNAPCELKILNEVNYLALLIRSDLCEHWQ
jgi:hypothetical protein